MANPTISQIAIGSNTYDICDPITRDSISSLKIIQKYSPNYADGSQVPLAGTNDLIFCTYPIEDYITQIKKEIDYNSNKYNSFSICQGIVFISNIGGDGTLTTNLGFYMADDNTHIAQSAGNTSYIGANYKQSNLCSGLAYMKNFCIAGSSRPIQGVDLRLRKRISGTTATTDAISSAYISIITFITPIL